MTTPQTVKIEPCQFYDLSDTFTMMDFPFISQLELANKGKIFIPRDGPSCLLDSELYQALVEKPKGYPTFEQEYPLFNGYKLTGYIPDMEYLLFDQCEIGTWMGLPAMGLAWFLDDVGHMAEVEALANEILFNQGVV